MYDYIALGVSIYEIPVNCSNENALITLYIKISIVLLQNTRAACMTYTILWHTLFYNLNSSSRTPTLVAHVPSLLSYSLSKLLSNTLTGTLASGTPDNIGIAITIYNFVAEIVSSWRFLLRTSPNHHLFR